MWVKLTSIYDNSIIYVNLDRFDRMYEAEDDDGVQMTKIVAVLSDTEGDRAEVNVKEKPEEVMKLAGVFVPSP